MPPLNSSAWSWSWDRGSTRVAAENPVGARSSRSSYSSYSSSSRPRYTMVFFMNEGDMPSPVLGQRSACSAAGRVPGRRRARAVQPVTLLQPHRGLPEAPRQAPLRPGTRRAGAEEGPADAHHGRAGGHRGLEVVAHAHGALLQPEVVGQAAHRREGLLAAASPGAATVMRPSHVEPEVAAAAPRARARLGRAQPLRPAQPGRVDLDQHRGPRGEPGDPLPLGRPGHALPRGRPAGEPRHLVPLHRAQEVPDDAWRRPPGAVRSAFATSSAA